MRAWSDEIRFISQSLDTLAYHDRLNDERGLQNASRIEVAQTDLNALAGRLSANERAANWHKLAVPLLEAEIHRLNGRIESLIDNAMPGGLPYRVQRVSCVCGQSYTSDMLGCPDCGADTLKNMLEVEGNPPPCEAMMKVRSGNHAAPGHPDTG